MLWQMSETCLNLEAFKKYISEDIGKHLGKLETLTTRGDSRKK